MVELGHCRTHSKAAVSVVAGMIEGTFLVPVTRINPSSSLVTTDKTTTFFIKAASILNLITLGGGSEVFCCEILLYSKVHESV